MAEAALRATHADPAGRPIRLLIVDDSIVARTVLARMVAARREFVVAGVAASVAEAFALLDRGVGVDVILLDLEMPDVDGLTALPELLARSDGARALIVSSNCAAGAAATVRALTLGAADTLLKPGAAAFNGRFAIDLAERLLRIARADPRASSPAPGPPPRRRREPMRCLAIGASTGGPHALAAFFAALAAPVRAPILVTQHLPPTFIPVFAAQLRESTGRTVMVAMDGARLVPDAILLAPGDAHLGLGETSGSVRVRLDRQPVPSGNMPSVDPMLVAMAERFGAGGVAVMLSGMGRDGAAGAAAVARAGGALVAQDAASSVVWGMPGAVAETGLASLIAPPAALAQHVTALAGRG